MRRTANIDVAIEHGADLVICYNPFRPFSNRVRRAFDRTTRQVYTYDGPPMADGGVLSVLNQVFRTLLHSRLQYGLRQYQDDPNFQGDIIVIEPKETDVHFFQLNALATGSACAPRRSGYVSVTESIEQNYDLDQADPRALRPHDDAARSARRASSKHPRRGPDRSGGSADPRSAAPHGCSVA